MVLKQTWVSCVIVIRQGFFTEIAQFEPSHCHSARRECRTKQLRALEQRATPRLPETLPYKHIFPNACDRYVATNLSSLSQHSSWDASKNYALSNDERPAAALTSPMPLIHPPIHMSGKLSNVASSLSQRPSRIATAQLRPLE